MNFSELFRNPTPIFEDSKAQYRHRAQYRYRVMAEEFNSSLKLSEEDTTSISQHLWDWILYLFIFLIVKFFMLILLAMKFRYLPTVKIFNPIFQFVKQIFKDDPLFKFLTVQWIRELQYF